MVKFHNISLLTLILPVLVGCQTNGLKQALVDNTTFSNPVSSYSSEPFAYTSEYNSAWQLQAVGASQAYMRHLSGQGQIVAVFDSGINLSNPDLAANYSGLSYDAITNSEGVTTDGNGHGTFVSGLIAARRNNTGTQGIAPDALLMPIRVIDASGSLGVTDGGLSRGIRYAVDHSAGVLNNSWNTSTTIHQISKASLDSMLGQTLSAYRYAISRNAIAVFAAGNDGQSQPGFYASLPTYYPELRDGWIASVATDDDGVIAPFSNRCGSSAAWCIAAPGVDVISTLGAGVGSGSGTSFSAPLVSGALAVLKSRWPALSNAQILNIIFTTANKSGIYADTSTYGQGFLDLEKATRPVGATSVATAGYTPATPAPDAGSSSASFGRAMSVSGFSALPETMIVDSYGRDFYIDTGALFSKTRPGFDAVSAMNRMGMAMQRGSFGTVFYAFSDAADSNVLMPGAVADGMRFLAEMPVGDDVRVSGSLNIDPSLSFGATPRDMVLNGKVMDTEAFANPYLTLAKNPTTVAAQLNLTDNIWVKGGSFFGEQATDPMAPQTLTGDPNFTRTNGRVMGGVAEMGLKVSGNSTIAINAGIVQEENAMLGSSSSGATRLADRTTTSFVAASATMDLGNGFNAFGGFEIGWSDVTAAANSLVTDIEDLRSESFRLGMSKTGVIGERDTFGIVLSQPVRASSGNANLNLVTGLDESGNFITTRASASLSAEARELDIQAFYATQVSADSNFGAGLMIRQNPGHDADAGTEAIALARFRMVF
jgi:hypothetical protein